MAVVSADVGASLGANDTSHLSTAQIGMLKDVDLVPRHGHYAGTNMPFNTIITLTTKEGLLDGCKIRPPPPLASQQTMKRIEVPQFLAYEDTEVPYPRPKAGQKWVVPMTEDTYETIQRKGVALEKRLKESELRRITKERDALQKKLDTLRNQGRRPTSLKRQQAVSSDQSANQNGLVTSSLTKEEVERRSEIKEKEELLQLYNAALETPDFETDPQKLYPTRVPPKPAKSRKIDVPTKGKEVVEITVPQDNAVIAASDAKAPVKNSKKRKEAPGHELIESRKRQKTATHAVPRAKPTKSTLQQGASLVAVEVPPINNALANSDAESDLTALTDSDEAGTDVSSYQRKARNTRRSSTRHNYAEDTEHSQDESDDFDQAEQVHPTDVREASGKRIAPRKSQRRKATTSQIRGSMQLLHGDDRQSSPQLVRGNSPQAEDKLPPKSAEPSSPPATSNGAERTTERASGTSQSRASRSSARLSAPQPSAAATEDSVIREDTTPPPHLRKRFSVTRSETSGNTGPVARTSTHYAGEESKLGHRSHGHIPKTPKDMLEPQSNLLETSHSSRTKSSRQSAKKRDPNFVSGDGLRFDSRLTKSKRKSNGPALSTKRNADASRTRMGSDDSESSPSISSEAGLASQNRPVDWQYAQSAPKGRQMSNTSRSVSSRRQSVQSDVVTNTSSHSHQLETPQGRHYQAPDQSAPASARSGASGGTRGATRAQPRR